MFRCLAYTEQPTNIISSNGMLAGGGAISRSCGTSWGHDVLFVSDQVQGVLLRSIQVNGLNNSCLEMDGGSL